MENKKVLKEARTIFNNLKTDSNSVNNEEITFENKEKEISILNFKIDVFLR